MSGTLKFTNTDARRIFNLCVLTGKPFSLSNDNGTYLMVAKVGDLDPEANRYGNAVVYAKGCNPGKDSDYRENSIAIMGGDDGTDTFSCAEAECLLKRLEQPTNNDLRINVTENSIEFKA